MFDPKESPAEILKRIREERANRSYYQDQGIRIDPLVIYKNAANKEGDIGPDPKTSLVPKVDPINYLRDIAGQITVNRAKEASLDVPRTLAEAFPERSKVVIPPPSKPEPVVEPAPEPTAEPAPEPATKKESKDFLDRIVKWDGKDFNRYISTDYNAFEDEEGNKLTGSDYYDARQKARPFLNPLRRVGMGEEDMQYYAKKAGITNVNSQNDLDQILKAYEADRG